MVVSREKFLKKKQVLFRSPHEVQAPNEALNLLLYCNREQTSHHSSVSLQISDCPSNTNSQCSLEGLITGNAMHIPLWAAGLYSTTMSVSLKQESTDHNEVKLLLQQRQSNLNQCT
jgi:hypothetical protein